MAEEIQRLVFLDSSVLIEFFRKTQKENSFFYNLQIKEGYQGFLISGIVQMEIYRGLDSKQKLFWDNLFEDLILVPFGIKATQEAVRISLELKSKRRSLAIPDLIIAATASSLNTPLATLNEKHFFDIDGLTIITPSSL
ncbi:MAG: type II toxin-antitoxin system VapC family toxin [Parafilimonas sp.]